MKLAEALTLRADLQKRVEQLRERLRLSALVQEGEQPPEAPAGPLGEVERVLTELAALITRINRTNIATTLEHGMTLTQALARRDTLETHHSILETVADTASNKFDRYSRSEIRKVSAVDVAALRRQLDRLAQERRELDTRIQATNWATDLVE